MLESARGVPLRQAGHRICFVNRYCYPDSSATSQLLTDLAGELSSRGWQVTIVGSRQRYDDSGAMLSKQERWRGVDIRRVTTTCFGRGNLLGRAVDYLSFYVAVVPILLSVLRRGDLVVAKTDPPLLGVLVAPVAKIRGALIINWLQDLFPEVASALGQPKLPAGSARVLRWMRNSALRCSAANVAIGERMGSYLGSQGVPAARVVVIPNWPHEDAIRPMPSSESQLRARLELLDRFVVGYSGNLGRAHEWKPLFEAARLLAPDSNVVFLVGGGGHGYDALEREVSAAGLTNVLFQPYHPMEFLSDSMAAADLHLVSLRPEMEGLVVPSKFYGIAASARAVGFVGDPEGELARLVRDHDCGFVVPAGRGDLLADSIRALVADPGRLQRQGGNARRLLDSHFSRASAHDRWHHLLTEVAAR